jgi:hypothetical protein
MTIVLYFNFFHDKNFVKHTAKAFLRALPTLPILPLETLVGAMGNSSALIARVIFVEVLAAAQNMAALYARGPPLSVTTPPSM